MRLNRTEKTLLIVLSAIAIVLCLVPQADSQVRGQSATKEQTGVVLTGLVNHDLVSIGILLGDEIAPGSYRLVLVSGEDVGLLTARVIGDKPWLESLKLTPSAAVMEPQQSVEMLRGRLSLFFGLGCAWQVLGTTGSYNRADVWVERSKRLSDGLVIEYSYSKWYPLQLFDLKVNVWPATSPAEEPASPLPPAEGAF